MVSCLAALPAFALRRVRLLAERPIIPRALLAVIAGYTIARNTVPLFRPAPCPQEVAYVLTR